MKNKFFSFILIIAFLALQLPVNVLGSTTPVISASNSNNKVALSVSGLPANVVSLQFEIKTNKVFSNAEMSWARSFDFNEIKKTDLSNGSKITVYVDDLYPLTANGSVYIGELSLSGLPSNTLFYTTSSLKLVNSSFEETVYSSVVVELNGAGLTANDTNNSNGSFTTSTVHPTIDSVTVSSGVASPKINTTKLIAEIEKEASPRLDVSAYASVNATFNSVVVKKLIDTKKSLEIVTKTARQTFDPSKIDTTLDLTVGEVEVSIKELGANAVKDAVILANPVEFTIKHRYNNKTTELKSFTDFLNKSISYSGFDDNVRAVRVLSDGSFSPVPAVVKFYENGRGEVFMRSKTNSVYAVVPKKNVGYTGLHWALTFINKFAKTDVIRDISAFVPDEKITRGEFIDIVVRALGLYEVTTESSPYKDVSSGHKYKDSITIAYKYKIATGYEDKTFKPDSQITRQEVAKILTNFFALGNFNIKKDYQINNLSRFVDKSDVGPWVMFDMALLVHNEVFAGDDFGRLNPKSNISKAEAVTVVFKVLKIAGYID